MSTLSQDRLFAQVVANEFRHVGVHRFVVGHAVAYGVGQRHIAGAIGAHQSGHAQHANRVRKHQRIQKIVVHAAVDHVHPLQSVDRLHVHDAAIHDQVAAFHQLDAHLLRQEAVLEISAVVDARRQQHDLRVRFAARRQVRKMRRKLCRIVIHRQDFMFLKRIGKRARHHQPIFQHIGNSAGRAHIVFQHQKLAGLGIAHQVDAADMRIDSARHFQADHLAAKVPAGVHQRSAESCGLSECSACRKRPAETNSAPQRAALSPRSILLHSEFGMMRGIRSKGNSRSVPRPSL